MADFRNFMGAVIDRKAFDKISEYLGGRAKAAPSVVSGGTDPATRRATSSSPRWWRPPTPGYRLLCEEIFGPVVTAYVYDDDQWEETLTLVDTTSPYALTGRGRSRATAARSARPRPALRNAAGNFYINDKPTGAVVGPAALRRRPRLGHQRQGRLQAEPGALGERAHDQGDVRPAAGLQVPVHGRGVGRLAVVFAGWPGWP